jgi:outer membrane immunogenic protein
MNTRFTRTCLAIAALLLGPLAARAADLPSPNYKAPAYIAPAYANWTGFYVGINGGYAWGRSQWSGTAGDFTVSPKGWVAGGTLGYNFQTGTWVWGVEGDFDVTDLNGTADICGGCEIKNTWLGTARLRLGYGGWNNWLPYITGGGAFGQIKATTPLGETNNTRWGWTAGAGLEWAFLANWSAKIEYLYMDLGTVSSTAILPTAVGVGIGTSLNSRITDNIFRGAINYHFSSGY